MTDALDAGEERQQDEEFPRIFPEIDPTQVTTSEGRAAAAAKFKDIAGEELRRIMYPVNEETGEPIQVSDVEKYFEMLMLYAEIGGIHIRQLEAPKAEPSFREPVTAIAYDDIRRQVMLLEGRLPKDQVGDVSVSVGRLLAYRRNRRQGRQGGAPQSPPIPSGPPAPPAQ